MSLSASQILNASVPIQVVPSGITISSRDSHILKARSLMSVNELGKYTYFKFLQNWKALFSITVTPLGITIPSILLLWKQSVAIVSIPLGKIILLADP